MEVHAAVKKMMLSIKIEETIPEQYYPFLREYLHQMYVVGYDQGRQEIPQHQGKSVGQYDKNGKLINVFRDTKEAAKYTGFTDRGIRKSIYRETPMRQGWTWEYINKKEGALTDTL